MDRLERLLSLVHVLQSAREPVPMSELRERFADYGEGTAEATRRKIERDKAELAAIGLAIRYVPDDEDGQPGYVLDVRASYLPRLVLDDADRRLLSAAARAALLDPGFPHRRALRLALAKLDTGEEPDGEEGDLPLLVQHRVADRSLPGVVETLSAALTAKKRVHVRYRKRDGEIGERDLEPYGLFLKRGGWYLCARDPDKDAVRVFRVSRIEAIEPNPKRPGTPDFAVPRGFDLRAYAALDPLRLHVHEPVEAAVRVDPEVAFLCERMWGVAPDAEGVFRITTTHLDVVVEQVLGLGRRAELLAPESARRAVVDALQRVLAAHGEGP